MNTARTLRGFTLIELLIVITVIAILASLAIPSMVESRKSANEASAVSTLHALTVAQESYRARDTGHSYGTLSELHDASLVDAVVGSGVKSGYAFEVTVDSGVGAYTVTADPVANTGNRHFYTDATGVIRYAEGAAASASSPAIS
jgi:prepilin-type N-terminal cleavage/methylation domain-containing protein